MIVLGIVGRARNGKSTVADAIQHAARTMYNLSAKQYSIGDLVLEFCIRSGRVPPKQREELNSAELQTLVHVGKQQRDADADFWIRKVRGAMIEDSPDIAIIPNVRFQSEVDLVKEQGGWLLRVTALNADGSPFLSPDRDPNDSSETQLHALQTDFALTAYRGETGLLVDYAHSVLNHIRRTAES